MFNQQFVFTDAKTGREDEATPPFVIIYYP